MTLFLGVFNPCKGGSEALLDELNENMEELKGEMENIPEVKIEEEDTESDYFVESGIVPLDYNYCEVPIKTEAADVSTSSTAVCESTSTVSSSSNSTAVKAIRPRPPVSTQSNSIGGNASPANLTSRMILPHFPVPRSNVNASMMSSNIVPSMNTSIVPNISTSIVPSISTSIVPSINTNVISNMNAGVVADMGATRVSNMNAGGVTNMNTTGVVAGGKT